MADRIIIDLREPLHLFVQRLNIDVSVPEYVLNEVVNMVFDVLIYELVNSHEEPVLSNLGNFYRDYLENDPRFTQRFLDSFFSLLKYIAAQLRGHGFYDENDDGFAYAPETNRNNRSIVMRKFDS